MKVYLSRSQSKAWATHEGAVGDPTGGPAYGEYTDVVGSVVGGIMGNDSAKSASKAQSKAAAASDATQRYQYDTTREDNRPFRDTGVAANNRLAFLTGLSGSVGVNGTPAQTEQQFRTQFLPQFSKAATEATGGWVRDNRYPDEMMWQAQTPGSAASVDEAGLQAAITKAMQQQAPADFDAKAYLLANPDVAAAGVDPYQHYMQYGKSEGRKYTSDPEYGSLMRNFTMADRDADPVYQSGLQFGLDEGNKGINRMAAASGSMLSGATLKALTKYGNDYGSTKAGESYNRFNNNQDRTYNKLAGLSGAGQQATAQVGAAGQNMANNISRSQLGVGDSRAASTMAGSNALISGMNQGISAWNNRGNSGGNYSSWAGNNAGVMDSAGLSPFDLRTSF